MASADSFAIELPPVPAQSLEGLDSSMIPLFDDALLSGLVGSSFVNPQEESPHLSPSGYSPSHAIPSPQAVEGTQDVTGSSSDELAQGRSGIIQKLPKKRIGAFDEEVAVKLEDDGSGSGAANDDDRDQKRQRRLMKNRESAQLSRQRKKVYVEELEKKVAQLQRTNDEVMKKNAVLNKENATLRDEVARLTQHLKAASARPITSSKSAKAAGVCLLVVLFSFGIIFNQTQRLPFEDSLGSVRARYIGRTLASTEVKRETKDEEEMPVVANPSIATPIHIEVKADDQAGLAQTDAKLRAPVQGSIHNIGSIAERARFVSSKERRSVFGDAKDRTSASSPLDAFDPATFQEQKRRKTVKLVTEQQPQHATTVMSDEDTPAVIQPLVSNKADSKDVVAVNDLVPYHVSLPHGAASRTRPVTQYFFCPEAQRLTPTNGESPSDVPPNYVALLIPGEMLNSTFAPPNSLVEVTCSVASMSIYPNYRAPLPEEEEPTALQRA